MPVYSEIVLTVWPKPRGFKILSIIEHVYHHSAIPFALGMCLLSASLSTLEGNDPPLKSLGWYGGQSRQEEGHAESQQHLHIRHERPQNSGDNTAPSRAHQYLRVKGDNQSLWHGESHFSAEMWWLDSREDGGVVDGVCREAGLTVFSIFSFLTVPIGAVGE